MKLYEALIVLGTISIALSSFYSSSANTNYQKSLAISQGAEGGCSIYRTAKLAEIVIEANYEKDSRDIRNIHRLKNQSQELCDDGMNLSQTYSAKASSGSNLSNLFTTIGIILLLLSLLLTPSRTKSFKQKLPIEKTWRKNLSEKFF